MLIIEDDEDVQGMLRTVLEGEGYHVNTLDTGAHVAEALVAHHPDALLLDLMMPERDGVAVLTDLQTTGVQIPVLVLSAYLPQEKGDALVAPWPGVQYLAKPFELGTLCERVQALVAADGAQSGGP